VDHIDVNDQPPELDGQAWRARVRNPVLWDVTDEHAPLEMNEGIACAAGPHMSLEDLTSAG